MGKVAITGVVSWSFQSPILLPSGGECRKLVKLTQMSALSTKATAFPKRPVDWPSIAEAIYLIPGLEASRQAAEQVALQTITGEATSYWPLLFLNNNLHVAHHRWPAPAWCKLPAFCKAECEDPMRNTSCILTYGQVFSRFLLTPRKSISHLNPDWLKR